MLRLKSIFAILCLLLLVTSYTEAQRTTYKGKKLPAQRSFNNPSLSRAKTGSAIPIFDEAGYPYQGIGLKVGDPTAITFKFYVSERFAFSADFGRSISSLYKTYYAELFDIHFPDPTDTLEYASHKTNADWVGELKFLYHFDASRLSKGLKFYTGLGWQVRDTKLEYTYSTKDPAALQTREKRRHQTMGAEAVLGTEYANFGIPVSLFFEVVYYYDVVKDPGWTRVQGGVGLRYIF